MGWAGGFVTVMVLVDAVVVTTVAVLAPAAMLRLASMRAAMVLRALFIVVLGWLVCAKRTEVPSLSEPVRAYVAANVNGS